MARRPDPASAKAVLAAAANAERLMGRELARGLRQAAAVIRDAASDPAIATSARARADAYRDVLVALADAGKRMTPELMRAINKRCEEVANGTAKALPDASPRRYELTEEQKVNAVNGRTAEQLVATQTQNMGEHAVRKLREAVVEAMNRGRVEGWTADELQREIQAAWDRKAGDESAFRFVDRGGRSWSNATYLQMLCRTTMQKITRNQMAATLAGNGYDVARISSDGGGGEECDACSRWEGRLVSLTGATKGLPTLADAEADGVFHPNCVHRIEYVDDDELEDAMREDAARREEQEEEAQETDEAEERMKASDPDTWQRMQDIGAAWEQTPMPFKEAGMNRSTVNPHFGEPGPDGYRDAYTCNCQRCVTAEELRQRGFRVEAKPTSRTDALPFGNRWMDAYEGGRRAAVFDIEVGRASSRHESGWKAKARIESLMASAGDGSRGIVRVSWKGRRSGHVFNVRNDGGSIVFYDAQTGREDASGYFRRISQTGCHFLRTDNLSVSAAIGAYVKPKA